MQRALGEIDLEQGTVDELLIRIPHCEHVFTVETLDGHCGMSEYYNRDEASGEWISLRTPPHGFQKPPVCPTCRAAITSPRYGRVFKRADLDILELNTVGRMSRALHRVCTSIQEFSKKEAETELTGEAATIKPGQVSSSARKAQVKARRTATREQRSIPISTKSLDTGNTDLHNISPAITIVWKRVTKKLMDSYNQAYNTAATRSAHVNAWDAAFVCLYNQEMQRSISDPGTSSKRPITELAMRVAKMTVGQPQPRADMRYSVEAIWATLDIRFTLVDLAQTWFSALCQSPKFPAVQRQGWANYILFLIDTCDQDARIAFEIAKKSESRRQMTKTSLLIMRTDLERFRFNVEMNRECGKLKDVRGQMAAEASHKIQLATRAIQATLDDHLAMRVEEDAWLDENFTSKAKTLLAEWRNIERSLLLGTFYEPVSLEEKMSIVKSFNFCMFYLARVSFELTKKKTAHTGHFYNCPNGHTFVIGEVRPSS
jgi:hypothetical protein